LRREYTHELGAEIRSISGAYQLDEEERKEIAGKEILYAIGNAVVDSACCGSFGCYYAVVLGYVVKWKFKRNDAGLPVSEVEPIRDELSKKEIEQILRTLKGVSQVQFW
jgi:hypothetical protein